MLSVNHCEASHCRLCRLLPFQAAQLTQAWCCEAPASANGALVSVDRMTSVQTWGKSPLRGHVESRTISS